MPINTRVLIAVDESDASHRAVRYVAELLGGTTGRHVGLIHLELPPRMLEWGGSEDPDTERAVSAERAQAYEKMERRVIEQGKAFLKHFRGIFADRGVDVTDLVVQFEEPMTAKSITEDLVKTARQRDYGTVVVGRQAFADYKRLFGNHVRDELVSRRGRPERLDCRVNQAAEKSNAHNEATTNVDDRYRAAASAAHRGSRFDPLWNPRRRVLTGGSPSVPSSA